MVIERDDRQKRLNAIKAEKKFIARGEKLRSLTSRLVVPDNLVTMISNNMIIVGPEYAGYERRGPGHACFKVNLDPKKREIVVTRQREYDAALKVARAYEKSGEKEFTVIKYFVPEERKQREEY